MWTTKIGLHHYAKNMYFFTFCTALAESTMFRNLNYITQISHYVNVREKSTIFYSTQGKILQYPNVGAPELPSNLSPIWLCPPCVFVDKHFKHWNNWNFKREAEADCCCQTQYWTPVIIRLVWLVLSALSRSQSLIFFSGREIHAWCGCLTCSAEWADWLIELLMLDLP